jgi:antitoxin ParD1/3/4
MVTMNVSLPAPLKTWVEAQVQTGHYSNSSDYVRDLIRRDQDYKTKRQVLIDALIVGETSGASTQNIDELWQAVQTRHGVDV